MALSEFEHIILDFDGVIKESLEAKADAFAALIPGIDDSLKLRIISHHQLNSGVSRYEKIPIYLDWAGIKDSHEELKVWFDRYRNLVFDRVVESDFVPGVLEFLDQYEGHNLSLVTATPVSEIDLILRRIGLAQKFGFVRGAPYGKSESINFLLRSRKLNRDTTLVIGDSEVDFAAAKENKLSFLLRVTKYNKGLLINHDISGSINNFKDLL